MPSKRSALHLAAVLFPILLAGCQQTKFSAPIVEPGVSGSAFGGQNPVSASVIQLYAVGTTADGSAATPLIAATLTTSDGTGLVNSNANAGNTNNTLPTGSFTITGDYICPSATAEVYLVATGGNPGLGLGNNANLTLMAALGPCGDLSSATYIVMNELTTVGAVAALSNFMTSYSSVGSSSSDSSQLQTAFLRANEYTNTTNGTAPGATLPAFFSASSTALQTLADIVASCVNSAGGIAGDPSTCGQLFGLTTLGAAPTDTVGAILDILKQPTVNVSQLYALIPPQPPFLPTLSSAPATWALPITSNTSTPLTYTLYAFPETDNSVTPLYTLINNAQTTIDMTMYALEDTTFSGDLVAACNRGVKVRVILDQNDEKSGNTSAYNQLNATANCSAVWANKAFQVTHQKSIILDGTQVTIMSLNLQSQYYSTTRDFALLENDPVDIAAIQATFNADYAAGTPSSGVAGASDYTYQPAAGDDLIWSPTTAETAMLAIINSATKTLLVENEELANSASYIVSAFESACTRGVTVHVAMVNQSSYQANFRALENAGCGVHVYPDTQTGFYIHAKAVVADYGLSTQKVYMGSINYSNASMTENRELGVYIADPASIQFLNATMTSDYAGGSPY